MTILPIINGKPNLWGRKKKKNESVERTKEMKICFDL